jgi:hypothetical protein
MSKKLLSNVYSHTLACGVSSVAAKAVCAHCGPFVLEYVKGGKVR